MSYGIGKTNEEYATLGMGFCSLKELQYWVFVFRPMSAKCECS